MSTPAVDIIKLSVLHKVDVIILILNAPLNDTLELGLDFAECKKQSAEYRYAVLQEYYALRQILTPPYFCKLNRKPFLPLLE